eukprot:313887-Chlamydomonas_euryale.AAC.1
MASISETPAREAEGRGMLRVFGRMERAGGEASAGFKKRERLGCASTEELCGRERVLWVEGVVWEQGLVWAEVAVWEERVNTAGWQEATGRRKGGGRKGWHLTIFVRLEMLKREGIANAPSGYMCLYRASPFLAHRGALPSIPHHHPRPTCLEPHTLVG